MLTVILYLNILLNIEFGFQIGQMVHLCTCSLGFVVLIFLWFYHKNNKNYNWTALFMALAILMWMAIDITRLIFDQPSPSMDTKTQTQQLLFINLFSAFNNAFLMATLFTFPHGFKKLKDKFPRLTSTPNWALAVLVLNVVIIIFYVLNWSLDINIEQPFLIYFDGLYSFISLIVFSYILILNYVKSMFLGKIFNSIMALFILSFLVLNFIVPFLELNTTFYRYTFLYSFHIILITSTIILLISIYLKETQEEYQHKLLKLKKELEHEKMTVNAYETELTTGRKEPSSLLKTKDEHHSEKRYLKFYMQNSMYVLELTMLERDVTAVKMQFLSLTREYKDLLQFAIYRKSQSPVRSRGGSHKAFGDIYKAIHDIRKRLLNPKLEEIGYAPLQSNELIKQKIKGSGVYELECLSQHISIDVETLSKNRELASLLNSEDQHGKSKK